MNVIKKTLPNGLRVLMVPQKDAVTATVLTLVGTGSNKETLAQNGLSHFLEHVCFKGTPTYPTAKGLNEAFEEIGAITNAFTSEEYTGYYAKGNPRHVHTLIGLVGDIVINATLPAEEVEKEKGVIIEEINMYEDMPQAKVLETLSTLRYGDTPAGRAIIGTKESVRSFTRASVAKYKAKHYVAANTVVAVVGGFDQAEVLKTVKKTFAAYPKGERGTYPAVRSAAKTQTVGTVVKPIDQTHIAIGFPTVPIGHKDSAAVSLLASILGGGMSSQLFHTLREELGVAYYVRAEQDPHSTYGELVITAGVDTARLHEVLLVIVAILKNIKAVVVSDKELSKVKEFSIGMLGMGLEATDMVAGFVATQELLKGEIKSPEAMAKSYLAVTPADILRVAKGIFLPKHARLSVVGPEAAKEQLAEAIAGL